MKHETIPASDLRNGDVLRLDVSTNYALIHSATLRDGLIAVTIYHGDQPNPAGATLFFYPHETVSLSMRDAKP